MNADLYCSWCGSALSVGQRYCATCGRQVGDQTVEDSEERSGFWVKLGTGLAAVVAVPLALIMMVVSTALPILIVLALVWGPDETWDRLRGWVPGVGSASESAHCEGYTDWMEFTADRQDEMYVLIEPMLKREITDPASLRDIGSDLRGFATAQSESDPPEEATALNALWVNVYNLMADTTAAVANGNYEEFRQLRDEYEEALTEVEEEDKRVRQACL